MATLLIVDDAAFSRRMMRKFLEMDGYEILEAATGREGLAKVQAHQPDCILVDLLMPDINGFEFLQVLQKQNSTIPKIVISADIQESSRQQALALGATQFLSKPVKEQEVRQVVRQVFTQC